MTHDEIQRQIAEYQANGGTIKQLDITDRAFDDSHKIIRSMLKLDEKRPRAIKALRAANASRLRLAEQEKAA
ncbi:MULTISPECIES: hypothetical protein [unclassified Oceanobacter]|uniref:hypothetical protein n=1 Tax=unclassified Oceanobacter TaxID=2620260 RepID=UPI0027348504|nr:MULTISPECIES: hypothetical protein [unclassified Oceanobacter]MDP2610052.1 hypothetical protein [Oceanobacter sp. 1_MG-2023]MDP2613312.1 hypothetical protein [Oceanobacter sp. 2_MG-2023]